MVLKSIINNDHQRLTCDFSRQVPLQELLQQYLLTDRSVMNEMTVIQLFAFFSSLAETLLCGLLTYSGEEHRQFGKRLGKLVRELIELATDELDLFVGETSPSPRLQVGTTFKIAIFRHGELVAIIK